MVEFFNEMSGLEKTFWFIAIPSSIILLTQLISSLISMDSVDEGNVDVKVNIDSNESQSSFQLFTFRNLVTFLAMSSWSALSFSKIGYSETSILIYSFLIGFASMFVIARIVYVINSMKEDIDLIDFTVGKKVTVYQNIPEKGKGKGKVTVKVNGSSKTMNASSNGPELSTNSKVTVVGIEDGELLVDESN